MRIFPATSRVKKIVFVTLLVDAKKYEKLNIKVITQWLLFFLFIRIPNKILVHTSHEVDVYKRLFKDSKANRIEMIPYFSYNKLKNFSSYNTKRKRSDYLVCAGNHRDLSTFIKAAEKVKGLKSIIIAGEGDRKDWEGYKHNNIKILFNQSYDKYQNIISNALALVIPIKANSPIRSLGLIAAFEAIYLKTPIIASDTFHLKDYFSCQEIYYFEPENENSLMRKINFVLSNPNDVYKKSLRGYKKTKSLYSRETFLNRLYEICVE